MCAKIMVFQSDKNWKIRSLLILGEAQWRVAGCVDTATEFQRRRACAAALDDSRFVREITMITQQLFAKSPEQQKMTRRLYELMELGLQQKDKPMAWFRRVQTESLLSEDASGRNLLAMHLSLVRIYLLLNRVYWFKLDRISESDAHTTSFGRRVSVNRLRA